MCEEISSSSSHIPSESAKQGSCHPPWPRGGNCRGIRSREHPKAGINKQAARVSLPGAQLHLEMQLS